MNICYELVKITLQQHCIYFFKKLCSKWTAQSSVRFGSLTFFNKTVFLKYRSNLCKMEPNKLTSVFKGLRWRMWMCLLDYKTWNNTKLLNHLNIEASCLKTSLKNFWLFTCVSKDMFKFSGTHCTWHNCWHHTCIYNS